MSSAVKPRPKASKSDFWLREATASHNHHPSLLNCPLVYLEHYPIGESELKSKTTLFFLPTYDTFKLGLEHKICIAPPELSHNMGYRQLVEPLCCNYRFYEQVLLWLQSESVKRIGKYELHFKGSSSGPAVRHTIARLDVASKMTAVLGGEGPVLNFEPTIEFAYDKKSSDPYAVARDKLQAVSDDWIAHPWRYPLDVSLATKLVLTNESPTSAWHDAGVISVQVSCNGPHGAGRRPDRYIRRLRRDDPSVSYRRRGVALLWRYDDRSVKVLRHQRAAHRQDIQGGDREVGDAVQD